MNQSLTTLEIHEIRQDIDKISAAIERLNPDVFEDSLELARYDEILEHHMSVLQASHRKARISESTLRLIG